MHDSQRPLQPVLLVIALLGPLFHAVGILTRGVSILYTSYPRLVFTYGFLALSGMAAAYLLTRRDANVRLIATAALLINLGSIAYAGTMWRDDVERGQADVTLLPVPDDKLGIVIAPGSRRAIAVAETRALEDAILSLLEQHGLEDRVVIRRAYPVSSEEQARRLGQRLRAQIVAWQTEEGMQTLHVTRHVTLLGANARPVEIDPAVLMMLLSTQETFSIEHDEAADATATSPLVQRVVAPIVAGFGSLCLEEPVLAASYLSSIVNARDVPPVARRAAHNYMGTAFLLADRPDLAQQQFAEAQALGPDAYSWIGTGTVHLIGQDWLKAERAYEQALELDPYCAAALCGVGIVRGHTYEAFRAVAAFERAIALEPEWGIPYAFLGLGYELQANLEGAMRAYDTSTLYAEPFDGLRAAATARVQQLTLAPPTAIPTATPWPTPTPTQVPETGIYIVQEGDTLKVIAERLGVTVEELAELNQLENIHSLRIGQVLLVPEEPLGELDLGD